MRVFLEAGRLLLDFVGYQLMGTEMPSPRIIGQRLAEARKTRAMTQEVAAEHLGVSRPTLIAIEKGERAPKAVEIVKLAALYGQRVSHFVRNVEPVLDFQSHFRAALEKAGPAEVEKLRAAAPRLKQFLAVHAYERGELSETELANYLRCDLWDARQVVRETMLSFEADEDGSLQRICDELEALMLADQA